MTKKILTRKEQIANRHKLAAVHRRAEHDVSSDESYKKHLLFLVGFHTIQATLWEQSHRIFGG